MTRITGHEGIYGSYDATKNAELFGRNAASNLANANSNSANQKKSDGLKNLFDIERQIGDIQYAPSLEDEKKVGKSNNSQSRNKTIAEAAGGLADELIKQKGESDSLSLEDVGYSFLGIEKDGSAKEAIEKLFNLLKRTGKADLNKDGKVDEADKQILDKAIDKNQDQRINPDEAAVIGKKLDTNDDGRVSKEEIAAYAIAADGIFTSKSPEQQSPSTPPVNSGETPEIQPNQPKEDNVVPGEPDGVITPDERDEINSRIIKEIIDNAKKEKHDANREEVKDDVSSIKSLLMKIQGYYNLNQAVYRTENSLNLPGKKSSQQPFLNIPKSEIIAL